MSETKKRWRPSLTAYRELESKLAEAERKISLLRADALACEENHQKKVNRLQREVDYLNNRGFWSRLFNVKYK